MPVAQLDVGQAVPLVGQRAQRLGQEADARRLERELAGLGDHGHAFGFDEVGDVDLVEPREVLPERLGSAKELDLPLRSRRRTKLALPKPRIATTRPATCTLLRLRRYA